MELFGTHEKIYNILLFGETDVRKSTFINAFPNFLLYESIKNAKENELISFTPSSFTMTDNNTNDTDESVTQLCKFYDFPFANYTIRLIDSPCIGDTRGIDKDYLNLENVLKFIEQFDELHAICILLETIDNKLNVAFECYIKQLLCNLEKSASNNIFFVLTNPSQASYAVENTTLPLQTFLDAVTKISPINDIAVNNETIFCIDSESFTFLVEYKNAIQFSNDFDGFEQSWIKSSDECNRLINKIIGLIPIKVRNSIWLMEALKVIKVLSNSNAQVVENIEGSSGYLQHRERQALEEKKLDILMRTLQSTKNSRRLVHESEEIGISILDELVIQEEKLSNVDKRELLMQKAPLSNPKEKRYAANSTMRINSIDRIELESTSKISESCCLHANCDNDISVFKSNTNTSINQKSSDDISSVQIEHKISNNLDKLHSGLARLRNLALGINDKIND